MRVSALPPRQPLLFQPFERKTPFAFSEVVEETRATWFPEVDSDIEVRVAALGPLASIWYHRMGYERHIVVFHPVLNRPDVPIEVVRFIAKHELTHALLPREDHTPSFWERELEAAPERFAVWAWLHRNLYPPLRETRWGLAVLRSWQKHASRPLGPYMPHLPFDDPPWKVLCPEGGSQLRFQPTWSSGPAPLQDA